MPKIVDHEQRRAEISEIAAGLIAGGGLEAATIRAIADSSGYSKGVVEHYFENKGELIDGALAWANDCYEERVARAIAGSAGVAALRGRILATLPLDETTRDEWRVRLVFWSLAAIETPLRKRQGARFRNAVAYFAGDISTACDAGELPPQADVDACARRLVNAVTGISISALHSPGHDRAFLEAEAEHLVWRLAQGHC